jgi:hypothetical protein
MSRRAKKEKKPSLNVNSRLKNVKILLSTQRVKEAIAYLYLIYTDLVAKKFGVSKNFSQTIRDFAIIMVKQHKQNPQNIYPFIQRIEKVVYGGYPATQEFFQELLEHFGKLYLELTGNKMPSIKI